MEPDKLKRLNIEVTSRCNYQCVGCPTHSLARGKGDMDPDLLLRIFEEAGNNLEKVFLWNYGEPLLHQQIGTMVTSIQGYSARKILSTNGSRLEDLQDLSFLRGLDEFIVSLNGLDDRTYNFHQVGGDFSKVVRGIKKAAESLKGSKTDYVLQVVANKGNIDQLDKAAEFARALGFNELVVKSFNVMDGQQETFDRFVPLGTAYSRYSSSSPLTKPEKSGKGRTCMNSMVINWNGEVNPCCWDYPGTYIIGNVKERGVYGVWNSPEAIELRRRVLDRKFPDFCVECAVNPTVDRIKIQQR